MKFEQIQWNVPDIVNQCAIINFEMIIWHLMFLFCFTYLLAALAQLDEFITHAELHI